MPTMLFYSYDLICRNIEEIQGKNGLEAVNDFEFIIDANSGKRYSQEELKAILSQEVLKASRIGPVKDDSELDQQFLIFNKATVGFDNLEIKLKNIDYHAELEKFKFSFHQTTPGSRDTETKLLRELRKLGKSIFDESKLIYRTLQGQQQTLLHISKVLEIISDELEKLLMNYDSRKAYKSNEKIFRKSCTYTQKLSRKLEKQCKVA